jgi:hypothetical protein
MPFLGTEAQTDGPSSDRAGDGGESISSSSSDLSSIFALAILLAAMKMTSSGDI